MGKINPMYTVYIIAPDGKRTAKLDAEHGQCAVGDCKKPTRLNAIVCTDCWFAGWEGELAFEPKKQG